MATVDLKDLLSTAFRFINHWKTVNAEPGASQVVLPGAYTVARLQADYAALEAAIVAQESFDNVLTNAIGDRDAKKAALTPRLSQFRKVVAGLLPGSVFAQNLPTIPPATASPGSFVKPFDAAANLWGQINAAPPTGFSAPLVLPIGYSLANFQADMAALRAAFKAVDDARLNAALARSRRDALIPAIETRLKQYRIAVHASLPMDSPLLKTVPAFTPRRRD